MKKLNEFGAKGVLFLSVYNAVSNVLPVGELVIGGSLALYFHGDKSIAVDYSPGDVDFCVSSEASIALVHAFLTHKGYSEIYNVEKPGGFTLRKQYKSPCGEKFDFFVVPGLASVSSKVNGLFITDPSIVWAARGFYAGIGSAKANGQLIDSGYIAREMVRPSYTKPTLLRRVVKRLIRVSLKLVSNKSTESYRVGCIIRGSNGLFYTGSNRVIAGKLHHAEVVAMAKMPERAKRGAVVYCTLSPCKCCEKKLAAYSMRGVALLKYSKNTIPSFVGIL